MRRVRVGKRRGVVRVRRVVVRNAYDEDEAIDIAVGCGVEDKSTR